MDLKQLEYFVRVAELESFTRASTLLGITQPSLSRQIRLLEVELRQTLLLRDGIAAYRNSRLPRHCGNTRSRRPSRSACAEAKLGRPAMPRPATAAARRMSM